jgi:AmmeMemoRadiSam system protein A
VPDYPQLDGVSRTAPALNGHATHANGTASAPALPVTLLPMPERRRLLGLARASVQSATEHRTLAPDPAALSPCLLAPRACFVTLTADNDLRGCIGQLFARQPLFQAVIDNAQRAALLDPRFPPIRADEVDSLNIEISVLSEPNRLDYTGPEDLLARLLPGQDGVLLEIGAHSATYLPQVWEKLRDPAAFLRSLASKAGCQPDAWRLPSARVFTYQAEHFSEADSLLDPSPLVPDSR